MLRNLLAIIPATIAGLAIAKFVEGLIGGGVGPGEAADMRDAAGLALGWMVGAFVAAGIALLIGRRWAPVGWLGAGTVFFAAIIAMLGFSAPLLLWPVSVAVCFAGGWGAIRLGNGRMKLPQKASKDVLFD